MEKILLMVIMLSLLGCVKIFRQNWVSPAGINMIENIFFIFLGVIVFGEGLEWNYGGILWLLLSCICFLLGQATGERIRLTPEKEFTGGKNFVSNLAFIAILMVVFVCLCRPLLLIRAYGFRPAQLLDLGQLAGFNHMIAVERYGGRLISLGVAGNILLVFSYFIALIGGYLFQYSRKRWERGCCLFTIVPITANMIVANGKAGMIAVVFLWCSGYLVAYLSKYGEKQFLSFDMIKKLLVIGGFCLFLFDFVMMLRIGEINIQTQKIVSQKMQSYLCGHIHAFCTWFGQLEKFTYDFGANTYMFLTNWLGITDRSQGVYGFMAGTESNVFTQNRGIITDFGRIGGLIYWCLLGNFSGVLWNSIKKSSQDTHLIAKVFLASIYFSVFYGFIVSPWIYSSYVLVFPVFALALYVIKRFKVNMKGR